MTKIVEIQGQRYKWADSLRFPLEFFDAPPAPSGGSTLKYWTGSAWVAKPLKYWTGSAWVAKDLKYWSGSSWI